MANRSGGRRRIRKRYDVVVEECAGLCLFEARAGGHVAVDHNELGLDPVVLSRIEDLFARRLAIDEQKQQGQDVTNELCAFDAAVRWVASEIKAVVEPDAEVHSFSEVTRLYELVDS